MDFSKYGYPSKDWLEFVASNDYAAKDGFSGNDPSLAAELQQTANEVRAIAAAELFSKSGMGAKIDISTVLISSRSQHQIPVRRYTPRDRVSSHTQRALVYFHGGGFLFGSETSDDYLCAEIALSLGITVLSVIYSHTPQYTHPTAHNDAVDAYSYIKENASEFGISLDPGLVVLGISAGASLAAGLVLHELDLCKKNPSVKPLLVGAALSIPWLTHVENLPVHLFEAPEKWSRIQCRNTPVLPWPRLKLFSDLLAAEDITDARLNIALQPDSELRGWPKTGFVIAGMDPLRDDGLLFAKRLEQLGTETSVHVFPGVPHGFRRWPGLPAAKLSDDKTLDIVRWLLGQDGVETLSMPGWHEYP